MVECFAELRVILLAPFTKEFTTVDTECYSITASFPNTMLALLA